MHFVFPWFLAALAVLAIPIIIHLFHFRRLKTVLFSNVAFLRNIETERKSRNKLKHLLVLFLRSLAFASLVMAFAMPGCKTLNTGASGKKAIVIYLDNSWSMDVRNKNGILFETAKQKARDIINAYKDKAKYRIVTNHISAETGFVSASEAIAEVDKVQISGRTLKAESVVKKVNEYLTNVPETDKEAYWISDFQESIFSGSTKEVQKLKYKVSALALASEVKGNLSIDTAWMWNAFVMTGGKTQLMFRIHNYYNEKLEDVDVKFQMDGAIMGMSKVSLEPLESKSQMLEFIMPPGVSHDGLLSVDDAEYAFDNTLYLVLRAQGDMKVKISGSNSFLEKALQSNAFFTFSAGSAAEQNAWYVCNLAELSESAQNDFISFVEAGGRGIAIASGDPVRVNNSRIAKSLGFPSFSKTQSGNFLLDKGGLDHPFFKSIFTSIPQNMEMPAIKEYLSSEGNLGSGDAILRLDNGDPYMLEFKRGNGRVILFSGPLDSKSGNLVQSTLFLPLVVNAAFNYEKHGNIFGFTSSGAGYPLQQRFETSSDNLVLKGAEKEFIPEIQTSVTGQELYIGQHLDKAGFYTLQSKQASNTGERIALNYSRLESNPAPASDETLKTFTKQSGIQWLSANLSESVVQSNDRESGLWSLFIWIAAVSFALEVLVLRFWDSVFRSTKLGMNKAKIA